MTILGDNDLSAFGAVVLRRGEMRGRAERAHFQGATGDLELRQDAVVETDQYRRGRSSRRGWSRASSRTSTPAPAHAWRATT